MDNPAIFGWSLIGLGALAVIWIVMTVVNFFSKVSRSTNDIQEIKCHVESIEKITESIEKIMKIITKRQRQRHEEFYKNLVYLSTDEDPEIRKKAIETIAHLDD